MRLIAPFARAYMLGDPGFKFETGDGRLKSVDVTLGEDARASTCTLDFFDPGLAIAGKLFQMSFASGGIQVPADLLAPPAPPPGAAGAVAGGGGGAVSLPTGGGGPAILQRPSGTSKAAQTAYYTQAWNTAAFDPARAADLERVARQAIANKARYEAVVRGTSIPWYFVAATHYRESTFAFDKHLHNGDPLSRRTTRVPAGRGPFSTWEESARDALFALKKLDRESDWSPAGLAWQFERYNGLGYAMKGRPSPYLWSGTQHYGSGKYVADGRYDASVKDQQLGCMAITLAILRLEGGGGPGQAPAPAPAPAPAAAGAAPAAAAAGAAPAAAPKPEEKEKPAEVSSKGTEIIVELGFGGPAQAIAYHFIHTGTGARGMADQTTTLQGQSVRWLMTRRRKNATYKDITLRELAEKVAKSYGLKLEMEGDGPKYQHLDQTGISDYELLLRECRAIGYRMAEEKDILKISPWRPKFTGFVVSPAILDEVSFSDRAQAEMQGGGGPTQTTSSDSRTSGDRKGELDRLTGQPRQDQKEDRTGTGRDSTQAVTGSATAPATGTVAPATPTRVEPSPGLRGQQADSKKDGQQGEPAAEGPKPDPNRDYNALKYRDLQELLKKFREQGYNVTGSGKSEELLQRLKDIDSGKLKPDPALVAAARSQSGGSAVGDADPVTGLPSQDVGAIDLADGRAEGRAIRDESRRVKGYESSVSFKTTPEALTIAPGSIIAIARECFESEEAAKAFASEWRVGTVQHSLSGGSFKTTLQIYKPQAQRPEAPPAAPGEVAAAPTTAGPGTTGGKSKLIAPMAAGVAITSSYGMRGGRMHNGYDLSTRRGAPVYASGDGVVSVKNNTCGPSTGLRDGCGGGYGRWLDIDHGATYGTHYLTRYAHLDKIHVANGAQVKQGQHIGDMGHTGRSSGPHLHYEVRTKSGNGFVAQMPGDHVLGLPRLAYPARGSVQAH